MDQQQLEKRITIVQLHNVGVSMLEQGDFKSAVRELTRALSYHKHTYDEHHSHRAPEVGDDMSDFSSNFGLDQCMLRLSSQRPTRRSSLVEKLTASWDENDDMEDDQRRASKSPSSSQLTCRQFVYRQAIEIPKEIENDLSINATVLISSIIVFNLALGYHFLALAMGAELTEEQNERAEMTQEKCDFSSVRDLLVKSTRLYELSFSLAYSMPWCMERGNAVLFGMAVANNLGVIFHQLNDETRARHCFQRVMTTLVFLVEYEAQDRVTNNQFQGFLRNATSSTCVIAAACAA